MTRDVTARLAEGRAAVANTATYVAACYATGYRHPDLTAFSGQVEDWYEAEDGLDLAALDADCAALRAAADAAEEAVRVERAGLAAVAAGWGGESGSSADDFIERQLRSAATVMTALRCAVRTCADLGEALWRQVDAKVSAAVAIDERRAGERAAWLAAAGGVLTGAGDRSDAVGIVEQQIRPYVDGDIRGEWVAAMRSGTAAVDTAYADAVTALSAGTPVHFEIPAQLGPAPAWNRDLPAPARPIPLDAPVPARPVPLDAPVPARPGAPATASPGSPSEVPAVASAAPPSGLPAPTSAVPAAPPPVEAAPAVPSLGVLPAAGLPMGGGTLPDGGMPSNLSRWLADAFGGSADPSGGSAETGEGPSGDAPDRPDPAQPPDQPAAEAGQDAEDVAAKEDSTDQVKPAEPEQAADVTPGQPAEPPLEPPLEPPAEPVAEAPVAAPPPPAEPTAEESTPCEIAAGELPQVGQ